jgi:hypothetical protein
LVAIAQAEDSALVKESHTQLMPDLRSIRRTRNRPLPSGRLLCNGRRGRIARSREGDEVHEILFGQIAPARPRKCQGAIMLFRIIDLIGRERQVQRREREGGVKLERSLIEWDCE